MKNSGFMGSTDVHSECWELLPWLANERATLKEVTRVEDHLRDCPVCQQELELQRRLREAIRTEDAVVLAPQTSLQKLMQRIDDDPAAIRRAVADSKRSAGTSSTSGRAAVRWSRWLPIAAGVQGVVIAGLLGALWLQSRELLTAPRFTTLTSPAVMTREPVIRVVFADGVALDDVNAILRAIDAQIVAGPSEAGVYTLELSSTDPAAAPIEAVLARLREDRRVLFSEVAVARDQSP